MQENVNITGVVDICLTDENGVVKHQETVENIIVATGLAHIASRMLGTAQASMGWIAVGTNNTAEAVGNTALTAELARVASTPTNVSTTQTNDTVQHVATFAVVNKGANDTLTVTWKVKIA